MLSKIDLRDFFEINQGLYGEAASARHLALLQSLAHVLEWGTSERRSNPGGDQDAGR